MVLNEKQKFLFVHIPKAAGSFVRAMLLKHSPGSYKFRVSHVPVTAGERHLRSRGQDPKTYFKFLTVRNPLSWYVSLYEHSKASNAHEWRLLGYTPEQEVSFDTWLRKLMDLPGTDLQDPGDGRPTTQYALAFSRSRVDVGWLTHRLVRSSFPVKLAETSFKEGRLLSWSDSRCRIATVLKTGNIREGLIRHASRLGLSQKSVGDIRNHKRINKRKHAPVSSYYTPGLERLVMEKDRYIFEEFGYDTYR